MHPRFGHAAPLTRESHHICAAAPGWERWLVAIAQAARGDGGSPEPTLPSSSVQALLRSMLRRTRGQDQSRTRAVSGRRLLQLASRRSAFTMWLDHQPRRLGSSGETMSAARSCSATSRATSIAALRRSFHLRAQAAARDWAFSSPGERASSCKGGRIILGEYPSAA